MARPFFGGRCLHSRMPYIASFVLIFPLKSRYFPPFQDELYLPVEEAEPLPPSPLPRILTPGSVATAVSVNEVIHFTAPDPDVLPSAAPTPDGEVIDSSDSEYNGKKKPATHHNDVQGKGKVHYKPKYDIRRVFNQSFNGVPKTRSGRRLLRHTYQVPPTLPGSKRGPFSRGLPRKETRLCRPAQRGEPHTGTPSEFVLVRSRTDRPFFSLIYLLYDYLFYITYF